MNRKRKLKQMYRFINRYGRIKEQGKRLNDEEYRKGSYYVAFDSKELGIFLDIGGVDKYSVYKSIVKEIRNRLMMI